jgi:hypothetical protein
MVNGHRKATCREPIVGAFRGVEITVEWDQIRKRLLATVSRNSADSIRDWKFRKDRIRLRNETIEQLETTSQ